MQDERTEVRELRLRYSADLRADYDEACREYDKIRAERDRYRLALWRIRGSDPWPGLDCDDMTSGGRYKSAVARAALGDDPPPTAEDGRHA